MEGMNSQASLVNIGPVMVPGTSGPRHAGYLSTNPPKYAKLTEELADAPEIFRIMSPFSVTVVFSVPCAEPTEVKE